MLIDNALNTPNREGLILHSKPSSKRIQSVQKGRCLSPKAGTAKTAPLPCPPKLQSRHALRSLLLISLLALSVPQVIGCSATRGVRPVGKGNGAVGLSLGGPVVKNLGVPIPAPMLSTFGRYGVGERTDLDFGIYFPVVSTFGVDFGASHLLLEQKGGRPAISAGGRVLLFGDALAFSGRKSPNTGERNPFSFRAFEELYANVSWVVADQLTLWTGLDLFAQIEELKVHPSLRAGLEWRPSKKMWAPGIVLETSYLAFLQDQGFEVVDYMGIAGYGAFGVHLGLNFYFERQR